MSQKPLETLKVFFQDRPDVLRLLNLRELDLSERQDEAFLDEQTKRELFPEQVNFYVTGRTSAGKTTLARTFLDPKQKLDTIQEVLKSSGQTDCTSVVISFKMYSNLRYFDLPGAGGTNDHFENINRAALLIRQVDDDDLRPIDKFEVWECSEYPKTKQVKKDTFPVEHWQSSQNQDYVAPDIILYVVAPHALFLRDDKRYLRALLRSLKDRGIPNKVVFALNIFHQKDGHKITTQENIENARSEITKVYQEFYSNESPLIVEIDCFKGTGIGKITELMCEILPDNKIGNMGQALRDELKEVAKKERSRRYRKALINIASRLATFVVDQKLGDQDLLNEAYMAVADYGIRVFREEDARLEAENELNGMVSRYAEQAKISRQEAIKKFVPDIEETTVMESIVSGFKPIFKDVTTEEEVPDYYQETERVKRSAIARGGLGVVEGLVQVVTSPISAIQGIFSAFGGMKEEDILGNQIHQQFDRDAYRNENVIKSTTRTVKRVQQTLADIETIKQDVPRKIQKIVQKEQVVGQKSLQGGYPVVETILAIGLGIENPKSSNVNDLETIVNNGKSQVQALLGRYQDQINQLAVNSQPKQAEANILRILESVLLK